MLGEAAEPPIHVVPRQSLGTSKNDLSLRMRDSGIASARKLNHLLVPRLCLGTQCARGSASVFLTNFDDISTATYSFTAAEN